MPNWKIHLEIGKRINETLKYENDDLELFMLGNLVPDINNAYIITDISNVLSHNHTHYKNSNDNSYLNFYLEYKEKMKQDPLVLGYFIHLFTDYFWNNNFYTNYKNNDDLTKEALRKLKQNDFKTYNNKYIENKITINNLEKIEKSINKIDRISLNKEDIIKIKEYIDNQKETSTKLLFYKENELDTLLENTVLEINNFLKNN